jgi:homoserine dehydrogenase
VRFLHEAAVMGGAPVFSLLREALPAARRLSFRGLLNSTTNLMLTAMEQGAANRRMRVGQQRGPPLRRCGRARLRV